MKNRFHLPLFACLLACVVVWTSYAQGPRPSAARPAWDYKIFVFTTGDLRGGESPPDEYYEDGKAVTLSSHGALPRLKELGEEGWELFQVVPRNIDWARWENRYYLKRAK
jgi:hypothetical protein